MSDAVVLSRGAPAADARGDDGGKRGQIIDGARKVFLASGFDAASMNEIARVAGVSKGTLYVYFNSKEDLFEALIRQDKRAQAEQTCRIDEEDDLRATLTSLGTRLLSRLLEPSVVAHFRTVIAVGSKFPRIGRAYYEAGPQFGMERLADFLRQKAGAGHLQIDDFELAANHFSDLCKSRHLLRAILSVEERPSEEQMRVHVAAAVEVFLRAYGVRP